MFGVYRSTHTYIGARISLLVCSGVLLLLGTSCKQVFTSDYFRMAIKAEKFPMSAQTIQVRQKVVSKPIDILFIVDNSGSMSNNQAELAAAFTGFANKYIKNAEWDLNIATITTDTYLAGTSATYPVTPAKNYAALDVGVHDGPRPSLNVMPRSGKPLLSTLPPVGTLADTTLVNQLISDLQINAKPGINGSGLESGLLSIIKFIETNEKSKCLTPGSGTPCLFRKNSTRVIIPFSDEVDNCANSNSLCALYPANADPALSRPAKAKLAIDEFFKTLDGSPGALASDPNYFVVALVDTNGGGISSTLSNVFYTDFVTAVKADTTNSLSRFSASYPLATGDVSAVLDSLGSTLGQFTSVSEQRYSTFTLSITPQSKNDIIVSLIMVDGGVAQVVDPSLWSLDGNTLLLNSVWAATLPSTYTIEIQYNPHI